MRHAGLWQLGILILVALPQVPASAQEWTRFRGPNGSGIGQAKNLPAEWSEKDYSWKTTLPGIGHSSPVVWQEKLFITSGDEKSGVRMVHCLSTVDGHLQWTREFPSSKHKHHAFNSFASSTPVVDASRVYTCWGTPEDFTFLALDHEGREVWRKDLGPYGAGHGSGSSPILFENMLVLANDKNKGAFLIALDPLTGETLWKTDRRVKRASYSTPCVYQPAGSSPLLIFTEWQQGITAVDPKTGGKVWEIDVFGQDDGDEKRAIGSPVIAGDIVIGTAGFVNGKRYVVAVRPEVSAGDKPVQVEEVYRIDRNVPQIPTLLVKDNLVFLWADNGIVTCINSATGKTHWQQRIGGNFHGSPVCVEDRLYAINEDGDVVVLAASDMYQLLARNPLGESSRSTPAVANNTLFLRTNSHVIAVRGK